MSLLHRNWKSCPSFVELRNMLVRAIALAEGDVIGAHDLRSVKELFAWTPRGRERSVQARPQVDEERDLVIHEAPRGAGAISAERARRFALTPRQLKQREMLLVLLRARGGSVSAVARAMDKARNQIVRWLHRYELSAHEFR